MSRDLELHEGFGGVFLLLLPVSVLAVMSLAMFSREIWDLPNLPGD